MSQDTGMTDCTQIITDMSMANCTTAVTDMDMRKCTETIMDTDMTDYITPTTMRILCTSQS